MSEAIEAVKTLVGWLLRVAGKVMLFIAWVSVAKGYWAMATMLEAIENFYDKPEQFSENGNNSGELGSGVHNGIKGFKARDERFSRLFLWFFANVLLILLLR